MTFCYDLSEELCSFDFFGWLVQAMAAGASAVTFDLSRVSNSSRATQKFRTILAPGPALAGLPARIGNDGNRLRIGSSRMGALVYFVRDAHTPLPRLISPVPAVKCRYTITLRRQITNPWRNSNEQAWREFAREIGAVVIEDYDVEPVHLHTRMALYAGAEMNFGVWCGPITLCTLTPYPVMAFGCGRGRTEVQMAKWKVFRGDNMPWCLPNQRVYWEDDTPEAIRRKFMEWKNGSFEGNDQRAKRDDQQGQARSTL